MPCFKNTQNKEARLWKMGKKKLHRQFYLEKTREGKSMVLDILEQKYNYKDYKKHEILANLKDDNDKKLKQKLG